MLHIYYFDMQKWKLKKKEWKSNMRVQDPRQQK